MYTVRNCEPRERVPAGTPVKAQVTSHVLDGLQEVNLIFKKYSRCEIEGRVPAGTPVRSRVTSRVLDGVREVSPI